MSYELCKYIKLDKKNNGIWVTIASSNVFPKTYESVEYCKGDDFTFDEKLLCLFASMQQGNIQISTINDNTENFEYAMHKVRQYLRENKIDSYEDLYIRYGDLYQERLYKYANIKLSTKEDKYDRDSENIRNFDEWKKTRTREEIKNMYNTIEIKTKREIYGQSFEIWKNALNEKVLDKYVVKYMGYPICKLGKYDRGYSRFSYGSGKGIKFSFKKASIILDDFQGHNLKMEVV